MQQNINIFSNGFWLILPTLANIQNIIELSESNTRGNNSSFNAMCLNMQGKETSLDVFKGLTIALLIIVDIFGGIWPKINHSPWDGITIVDLIMYFFLYIVGMDVAFGLQNVANKIDVTKMNIFWTILFILGLISQGKYYHGINNLNYGVDLDHICWFGISQKIAFAYLVITFFEIWVSKPNKDDDTSIIYLDIYQKLNSNGSL